MYKVSVRNSLKCKDKFKKNSGRVEYKIVGLGACRGCIPKPKANMKRSHLINSDTNAKASLIILL